MDVELFDFFSIVLNCGILLKIVSIKQKWDYKSEKVAPQPFTSKNNTWYRKINLDMELDLLSVYVFSHCNG